MNSRELFRDGPRIEIEHQGEIYRLQITRLGRLILTK
ncbi:MAG TPA: hemin uptake protein HemP [Gammaproteobacteria bacterium]|nr:hemin uptake protein HemP [Gammaproteobacteria bacterium]